MLLQAKTHTKTPKALVWSITKPSDLTSLSVIPTLNVDEQKRAMSFKNNQHGQWWAYVRYAMRSILSSQLGCERQKLVFGYSQTKKPFLAKNEWSNVYFNLSHCDNAALLAISNYAELGIDIERVKPISDMNLVAKHFFSSAELRYFEQFPNNRQSDIFYEIWTQKEALIKANGGGLSLPLKDFNVVGSNSNSWHIINTNTIAFKHAVYAIKQITLEEWALSSTHKAAVCFALERQNNKNFEQLAMTMPAIESFQYLPTELK